MQFLHDHGFDVLLALKLMKCLSTLLLSFSWMVVFFTRRKQLDRIFHVRRNIPGRQKRMVMVMCSGLVYSILFVCLGTVTSVLASINLYSRNTDLPLVAKVINHSLTKFRPLFTSRLSAVSQQLILAANGTDTGVSEIGRVSTEAFHSHMKKVWFHMLGAAEEVRTQLDISIVKIRDTRDMENKMQANLLSHLVVATRASMKDRALRKALCDRFPQKAGQLRTTCHNNLTVLIKSVRFKSRESIFLIINRTEKLSRLFQDLQQNFRESLFELPNITSMTIPYELSRKAQVLLEREIAKWRIKSIDRMRSEIDKFQGSISFRAKYDNWENDVRSDFGGVLPGIFILSVVAFWTPFLIGFIILAGRTRCFVSEYQFSVARWKLLEIVSNSSFVLLFIMSFIPVICLVMFLISANECGTSSVVIKDRSRSGTRSRLNSTAMHSTALKPCKNFQEILSASGRSRLLYLNSRELQFKRLPLHYIRTSVEDNVKSIVDVDVSFVGKFESQIVSLIDNSKYEYRTLLNATSKDITSVKNNITEIRENLQSISATNDLPLDVREIASSAMSDLRKLDILYSDFRLIKEHIYSDMNEAANCAHGMLRSLQTIRDDSMIWNKFVDNAADTLVSIIHQSVQKCFIKYAKALDIPLNELRSSSDECEQLFGDSVRAVYAVCDAYFLSAIIGYQGQYLMVTFLGFAAFLMYWMQGELKRHSRWSWGALPSNLGSSAIRPA